jgi:hypothetical protein
MNESLIPYRYPLSETRWYEMFWVGEVRFNRKWNWYIIHVTSISVRKMTTKSGQFHFNYGKRPELRYTFSITAIVCALTRHVPSRNRCNRCTSAWLVGHLSLSGRLFSLVCNVDSVSLPSRQAKRGESHAARTPTQRTDHSLLAFHRSREPLIPWHTFKLIRYTEQHLELPLPFQHWLYEYLSWTS